MIWLRSHQSPYASISDAFQSERCPRGENRVFCAGRGSPSAANVCLSVILTTGINRLPPVAKNSQTDDAVSGSSRAEQDLPIWAVPGHEQVALDCRSGVL